MTSPLRRSISFALLLLANIASASIVKPVKAERLFVPVGFDDNDEVVAVLDGYLPDSCHRVAGVEVQRLPEGFRLQALAHLLPGDCKQFPVPYMMEARLGRVDQGEYRVATKDGKLVESLTVKEGANPGPDDFLYVPVDSARIASLLPAPGSLIVIEGRYTDTCLKAKDVKVIDSGKTIEVLPIMEREEPPTGGCQRIEVPFTLTAPLPEKAAGRYLMHVRSLNGRAVNVVFNAGSTAR